MSSDPVILCINSGSSSLKFALYRLSTCNEVSLYQGSVGGVSAISQIFELLDHRRLPAPHAVGHRVVHGGREHRRAERVDEALLAALQRAVPFAPLHLPAEIQGIEAVRERLPDIPQVVCYDTDFHRPMPEIAARLPLPRDLHDRGIKRYGFHGLSYEYVVEALGTSLGHRAVVAHLGSGSSMVALCDGKPVDTTMGLTPAGGVMMGTRTGDLDPGVVFHLLAAGLSAAELEEMLNHESGLLGVSGRSSDMATLLDVEEHDAAARMAVQMYCYQAKRAIGSLAAALGGIDSLVFTGGIGENAAPVRERICRGLEHLGIVVDPARNQAPNDSISAPHSKCLVRVVATNEQLMIARKTRREVFAC